MNRPMTPSEREKDRHAYRDYERAIYAADLRRTQALEAIKKRHEEQRIAIELNHTNACMTAQKEAEENGIVFGGKIDE